MSVLTILNGRSYLEQMLILHKVRNLLYFAGENRFECVPRTNQYWTMRMRTLIIPIRRAGCSLFESRVWTLFNLCCTQIIWTIVSDVYTLLSTCLVIYPWTWLPCLTYVLSAPVFQFTNTWYIYSFPCTKWVQLITNPYTFPPFSWTAR